MANYEATRYDWDGEYLTGIQGINTGIVIPWSSISIPSEFLECNGQSVSTATYAGLFAVIGYTYGGSGANFNVPDLTDRTVVNKSNTKNLAQTGGANTVVGTGNVTGTVGNTALTSAQMPAHTHMNTFSPNQGGSMSSGGDDGALGNLNNVTSAATGQGQSHTHNSSASFLGGADSVLQPFIVMIYIIKT